MGERTRNEPEYRDTYSKDGTISTIIPKETAERVRRYCKAKNLNKTKFIERCCIERLDALEPELYQEMPKDVLIEWLLEEATKDELIELLIKYKQEAS